MTDPRRLINHLQDQDADTLITGARRGMRTFLLDLNESGLFCESEMFAALEADSVTVTSSKEQLVIKYTKNGYNASETREFVINLPSKSGTSTIL